MCQPGQYRQVQAFNPHTPAYACDSCEALANSLLSLDRQQQCKLQQAGAGRI
jgi:hypothetical protein